MTALSKIAHPIKRVSPPPPASHDFDEEKSVSDRKKWLQHSAQFGSRKHYDHENAPSGQADYLRNVGCLAQEQKLSGRGPVEISFADVVLARGSCQAGKLHGDDGIPAEVVQALPSFRTHCHCLQTLSSQKVRRDSTSSILELCPNGWHTKVCCAQQNSIFSAVGNQ